MAPAPSWIDPESWAAFHEMRRKLKAPLTAYAEKLIIRELVRLKSAGQDPQACLDQSIMNGWRDVFPLRDKGIVQSRVVAAEETAVLLAAQSAPREGPTEAQRAALAAARRVGGTASLRAVQ